MSCRSYRPCPDNGSGDSPRPPFLTEFVNHIGESSLVDAVYHLIGSALAARIHAHVERPFRLKTESACCVGELHGADSQVGQQTVCARRFDALPDLGIRIVDQLDARRRGSKLSRQTIETLPRQLQRRRILIEANQTSLWAEALCDFVRVAAKSEGRVDIAAAALHVQKMDRFF